jgi:hypothetical protein
VLSTDCPNAGHSENELSRKMARTAVLSNIGVV